MTKHLAKAIDIYSGRDKGYPFWDCDKNCITEVGSLLKKAEAYDFGHLPLEPDADNKGAFIIPRLTDDEMDFFVHDVLPFPAEVMWLQFTLTTTSALLIDARKGQGCRFRAQRFDMEAFPRVECPGVWGEWYPHMPRATALTSSDRRLAYNIATNPKAVNLYDDMCHLTLYMVMMLYSKTTAIEVRTPSRLVNRIRRDSNRAELPEHRIVTIVPGRWIDRDGSPRARGEQRPKRIHWRRSHLRHYEHETPHSRYAPEIEHKGRKGWHVVAIPRFLVGSKEAGEVSHEYRIKA